MELLVAVDVVSSKLAMTNECHKVVESALVILPVPPKNRSARRDDSSAGAILAAAPSIFLTAWIRSLKNYEHT